VESEALFSYVNCEVRMASNHPLRPIRKIVDAALGALTAEFEHRFAPGIQTTTGRGALINARQHIPARQAGRPSDLAANRVGCDRTIEFHRGGSSM
jgi:hypothetical protein